MATSRPFVALAVLASLAASGCGEDGPVPPLFARLAHATLEPATLPTAPLEPRMVELCGDVRPAFVVTAGAPLYFELPTLRATAWLDVAVAVLPEESTPPPAAEESTPPPAVRLRVELADRVGAVSGGVRELVYDALPSPGRPPAFGWGEARIELPPARDRAAALNELILTVELAEPLLAGAAPPKLLIALPRLAERAFADVLPKSWIEWRCELPPEQPLPDAAELERLLAAAGAQLSPLAASRADARAERPAPFAGPREGIETLRFDRHAPIVAWDPAAPFDRFVRFDGAAAPGPVAAALPQLAGWGEAVLAERQRQLGEHRLFLEIARPRHAPLHVMLVTLQSRETALAALRRLVDHVAANELVDRTWLDVTFVAADGQRIAFRRRPATAPHDHG